MNPVYQATIDQYLAELKRTTHPLRKAPIVTVSMGWITVSSLLGGSITTWRLREMQAAVERLKQRTDYKPEPPARIEYLNQPDFHERKRLRKLRTDIKQSAPYLKAEGVEEFFKDITKLDLIRLILGQDHVG